MVKPIAPEMLHRIMEPGAYQQHRLAQWEAEYLQLAVEDSREGRKDAARFFQGLLVGSALGLFVWLLVYHAVRWVLQ